MSFDRLLSAFKGRGTRYRRNHVATVCSKCVANAKRAGIGVNLLKQSGGMPHGGNYDMRHSRWHGRSNCRNKGNPDFKWSPRGGWILFVPHISFITVWEPIISVQILTQWPFQSQAKSIIQNRWNSRSSSFSKTIWNRYISHSIITCIPFCQHRKRFVFSPFTLISVSVLVWIISQMAFVRVCGYNQFRWVSWVRRLCHRSSLICCYTSFKHCVFYSVANQWFILSDTKQVWWIDSDRYGKRLCVLFSLFVSCYGVNSGCLWQLNFFYEEIESLWYVADLETVR